MGLPAGDEVIDPPYCGVSGSGIWSAETDCTEGDLGIWACCKVSDSGSLVGEDPCPKGEADLLLPRTGRRLTCGEAAVLPAITDRSLGDDADGLMISAGASRPEVVGVGGADDAKAAVPEGMGCRESCAEEGTAERERAVGVGEISCNLVGI